VALDRPGCWAGREADEEGVLTATGKTATSSSRSEMDEKDFVPHQRHLVNRRASRQALTHTQWRVSRLPDSRGVYCPQSGSPTGPRYRIGITWTTARPEVSNPTTPVRYGPRATDSMIDDLDKPDDL